MLRLLEQVKFCPFFPILIINKSNLYLSKSISFGHTSQALTRTNCNGSTTDSPTDCSAGSHQTLWLGSTRLHLTRLDSVSLLASPRRTVEWPTGWLAGWLDCWLAGWLAQLGHTLLPAFAMNDCGCNTLMMWELSRPSGQL